MEKHPEFAPALKRLHRQRHRLVARQNRYAPNEDNIVGQDLGKSAGFGVFSLHGGYRWNKNARVTFGVDNLFD
ncbi:MAG: TonB-dependent receptor, partial [Zoogloeaceae bacterium]|nr:TonB-dependent receptor [Zoogloeaceae bacterium]